MTALAEADPNDGRPKSDRAGLLLAIGELQAETQATAEAEGSLELARTLYQDLLEVDPKHSGFREGLVSTLAALSKLLAGLGDSERALEYVQEALATARQFSQSMLRDLAITCHLAGDNQRAVETTKEALRLFSEKQEHPKTDELRQQLEADLQRYRR